MEDELYPDLKKLSQVDGLGFDIDLRMQELWNEALEVEEWGLEQVAPFMRAAYGKGYVDALKEEGQGERGKLCTDHGYKQV